MGLISLILKFLGFPDFPVKGQKTFNATETTFGSNVIVTGETIEQGNSVTLKEKLICCNLWLLKNPFNRNPIIPNIIGSFGTISGWSGVFVTGLTETLGSNITNGSDINLGAADISYSALQNNLTGMIYDVVPESCSVSPSIDLTSISGNLNGYWTYHGVEISTEPDVTSDIRLKKNIERFESGLNIVLELKPVRFDWREDKCPSSFIDGFREPEDIYGYPGKVKRQYGLIAQEVEEIAPDLVGERKMYDETYKMVRYEKIVPILISAVQELNQKIEELQNKIDALTSENK